MFAQSVLLLAALMFGAFGVWLVLDPDRLDVWLGIQTVRPEGKTELRAFYGGLEVGMAVFLAICAVNDRFRPAGLAFVAIIHFAIAAARLYGCFSDSSLSGKLISFLAIELSFAVAATIALVRTPSIAE